MSRARKYPVELLERATRLVFESGRPIAHVASDLGLPSETLRKYVRQVEANEGRRPDLPTAEEREEIKRLRQENFELRRANEILKAASVGSTGGRTRLAGVDRSGRRGDGAKEAAGVFGGGAAGDVGPVAAG